MVYQICKHDNHPEGCADCLRTRIAHLEQQAARLANLPGLPEGWSGFKPEFSVFENTDKGSYKWAVLIERCFAVAYCDVRCEADFLVNLLNTCYPPAPGQEKK